MRFPRGAVIDYSLMRRNEEKFEQRVAEKFLDEEFSPYDEDLRALCFINSRNDIYNIVSALIFFKQPRICDSFLRRVKNPLKDAQTAEVAVLACNFLASKGVLEIEEFESLLESAAKNHPTEEMLDLVALMYATELGNHQKAYQTALRLKEKFGNDIVAKEILERIEFERS